MTAALRLLIVDDETALAGEIEEYVVGRGAHPVVANDAETAFVRLGSDPGITVVLSDIRMPGRDGLSLLQNVLDRRDEANAIEVVLMTGHASLDDAILALQCKAFDYVRKPFSLAGLWQTLERAHASALARRAAATRLTETSERIAREVISVFNHEFRSPLVPIVGLGGMIEQLAGNLSTAELAECGGLIRSAGEHLTALTDQGLMLAGLVAGTEKPSLHPVSPAEILACVATAHAEAAAAQGQVIEQECGIDRPVVTDRQMLVGALRALIANAIRFSPRGSTVRLSAAALGDGVAFVVADQGKGMTAAEIDIALQPFRQVDMSLKGEHKGLGLGLSLANRIAQALGGRLNLHSVVGQGTVAQIELPGVAPA